MTDFFKISFRLIRNQETETTQTPIANAFAAFHFRLVVVVVIAIRR